MFASDDLTTMTMINLTVDDVKKLDPGLGKLYELIISPPNKKEDLLTNFMALENIFQVFRDYPNQRPGEEDRAFINRLLFFNENKNELNNLLEFLRVRIFTFSNTHTIQQKTYHFSGDEKHRKHQKCLDLRVQISQVQATLDNIADTALKTGKAFLANYFKRDPDTITLRVFYKRDPANPKTLLGVNSDGHVSLEICTKDGEREYISFYPGQEVSSPCVINEAISRMAGMPRWTTKKGHFALIGIDAGQLLSNKKNTYEYIKEYQLVVKENSPVDIKKVLEAAKRMKGSQIEYGFYGNNCSQVALSVLKDGGFEDLLPFPINLVTNPKSVAEYFDLVACFVNEENLSDDIAEGFMPSTERERVNFILEHFKKGLMSVKADMERHADTDLNTVTTLIESIELLQKNAKSNLAKLANRLIHKTALSLQNGREVANEQLISQLLLVQGELNSTSLHILLGKNGACTQAWHNYFSRLAKVGEEYPEILDVPDVALSLQETTRLLEKALEGKAVNSKFDKQAELFIRMIDFDEILQWLYKEIQRIKRGETIHELLPIRKVYEETIQQLEKIYSDIIANQFNLIPNRLGEPLQQLKECLPGTFKDNATIDEILDTATQALKPKEEYAKRHPFFNFLKSYGQVFDETRSKITEIIDDTPTLPTLIKIRKIHQLIDKKMPSAWKFWRRNERKQYLELARDAETICTMKGFYTGRLNVFDTVSILNNLGEKSSGPELIKDGLKNFSNFIRKTFQDNLQIALNKRNQTTNKLLDWWQKTTAKQLSKYTAVSEDTSTPQAVVAEANPKPTRSALQATTKKILALAGATTPFLTSSTYRRPGRTH